jgi:hypothetical protein
MEGCTLSAPHNQPSYDNIGEEPPDSPEDGTWQQTGTYVTPTVSDLQTPPAPGTALPPMLGQLGETDYAPGRFASGADVDHHVYPDDFHGPAYGERGTRPFPN